MKQDETRQKEKEVAFVAFDLNGTCFLMMMEVIRDFRRVEELRQHVRKESPPAKKSPAIQPRSKIFRCLRN